MRDNRTMWGSCATIFVKKNEMIVKLKRRTIKLFLKRSI
jgi:hypothetical protein